MRQSGDISRLSLSPDSHRSQEVLSLGSGSSLRSRHSIRVESLFQDADTRGCEGLSILQRRNRSVVPCSTRMVASSAVDLFTLATHLK